jgi:hypothetical protein
MLKTQTFNVDLEINRTVVAISLWPMAKLGISQKANGQDLGIESGAQSICLSAIQIGNRKLRPDRPDPYIK